MIEIPFLAAEAAFSLIWLAVRVFVWIRQKKIFWKREALLLLMFINLAVIIRFVFFPRGLVNGHIRSLFFEAKSAFPFRVNLIPFVNLFNFKSVNDIIWNVAGNTAMFIPTGIILPVVYKKLNSFGKVVAAGASISLCIELLQLPFASRTSDVDDLILNTLGVIIGYGIYALVKKLKKAKRYTNT